MNELMRDAGGFEGNAQTLRVLTRLEKKLDNFELQYRGDEPAWYRDGEEVALGLNLCARSLASVLKYDNRIPIQQQKPGVVKGYYASEGKVVDRVKGSVLGSKQEACLRTVECQVMDIADDIAYSTYDLEDALKGRLVNPLDMLYPSDKTVNAVARRAGKELGGNVRSEEVRRSISNLFSRFGQPSGKPGKVPNDWFFLELGASYKTADSYAFNGFFRSSLTSDFVNRFLQSVDVELDHKNPCLSKVVVSEKERLNISVLKNLIYEKLINSPRLKLVAHRGERIVREIFEALAGSGGESLLPEDFRARLRQSGDHEALRRRVICDFISGMTDRYAVEFYARLRSDSFHSMFKLH